MTEASSSCGTPEGVIHAHSERCWKAGYAAGVADTAIATAQVQNGDVSDD